MKKQILFLLMSTTIIFTSCSSDDNSPNPDNDPFVGTWNESRILFEDTEQPHDDCQKQSYFIINSDGSFREVAYSKNNENCELDFDDNGTWENLGNNSYKIKYDPEVDDYEEIITLDNNEFFVSYDDPYFIYFTKN